MQLDPDLVPRGQLIALPNADILPGQLQFGADREVIATTNSQL